MILEAILVVYYGNNDYVADYTKQRGSLTQKKKYFATTEQGGEIKIMNPLMMFRDKRH